MKKHSPILYDAYISYDDKTVKPEAEIGLKSIKGVYNDLMDYIIEHELSFKANGELPQVLIETWADIWHYFSDENYSNVRCFKIDYEL